MTMMIKLRSASELTSAAHFPQIGKDAGQLLGGYHIPVDGVLQHPGLLGRHITGTETSRSHGQHQGNACGKSKADGQGFFLALHDFRFIQYLLQSKDGQQGYGELCDDKDGRHRTEFVVHRHVVNKEIRQRHEILSPSQDDGEKSSSYQRPFQRTFHNETSQNEQEKNKSTHIDRA